jgi:hypothetical protein
MVHSHHSPSTVQTLGLIIGSITGIAKAGLVKGFFVISAITASIEVDTAILAAIGATVGFAVTTLWKFLLALVVKKLKERKRKNEKAS